MSAGRGTGRPLRPAAGAGPGDHVSKAPVSENSLFDAALFDMDGLLVDSEPLWHEAEITILGGLGVPVAADDCRQTKGMFATEVTRSWYQRHPWGQPPPEQVAEQVVEAVIGLVQARGTRRPGVEQAIELCRGHGLRLALASSSPLRLISAVLHRLELTGTLEVVHSAEHERAGKPDPGVFLTAAARLGVAPRRCVVWEDSAAGVEAAGAAGMVPVAVPEPAERHQPSFGRAQVVLGSLAEADGAMWTALTAASCDVASPDT